MRQFTNLVSKPVKAFFNLPRFLRFGVLVFVLAGAVDLSYHAISAFWPGSLDAYLGPDGYYAHLALFLGMLFIVVGVILTRPNPEPHQENRSTPNSSSAKPLIRR